MSHYCQSQARKMSRSMIGAILLVTICVTICVCHKIPQFTTEPDIVPLGATFNATCNVTGYVPNILGFSVHFYMNYTVDDQAVNYETMAIYTTDLNGKNSFFRGFTHPSLNWTLGEQREFPLYQLKMRINHNHEYFGHRFGCIVMWTDAIGEKAYHLQSFSNSLSLPNGSFSYQKVQSFVIFSVCTFLTLFW